MLTQAYQNNFLPKWAYFFLAALCAAMGVWMSSITLEYFEHGSKVLEADTALQALAASAALMFVAAEMAAFGLAALLTEKQLLARRWQLYAFAGAVLTLEVCTIVIVQLSLTTGADMSQDTVLADVADLERRIKKIEDGAAATRQTAELQRAAGQLKKAGQSDAQATAEEGQTKPLYEELTAARKQKRPTITKQVGEKTAMAYVIGRGILISIGGMIFFGVAGALLRIGRGGVSIEVRTLQMLERLESVISVPDAPAALSAPAAPAPALASFKPAGTVAPTGASTGFSYGSKMSLAGAAGAGLLAATAAPVAHSAPAVPAAPVAPVADLSPSGSGINDDTPPLSTFTPPGLDRGINVDTPTPVNDDTPDAPAKARKPRQARDGLPMDSGTGLHDGYRYRRAVAGVQDRTIRPSLSGLYAGVGATADVARRFIAAMAAAGEIVRNAEDTAWIPAAAAKAAKQKKKGGAA